MPSLYAQASDEGWSTWCESEQLPTIPPQARWWNACPYSCACTKVPYSSLMSSGTLEIRARRELLGEYRLVVAHGLRSIAAASAGRPALNAERAAGADRVRFRRFCVCGASVSRKKYS